MKKVQRDIKQFVDYWTEDSNACKAVFSSLCQVITGLGAEHLEFHVRAGVSSSLRGLRQRAGTPRIFVMIDVVEDQPRWLSVCFYATEVTDPAGHGDYIPGGLLGEDGHCFTIESNEQALVSYVKQRITEAFNYRQG